MPDPQRSLPSRGDGGAASVDDRRSRHDGERAPGVPHRCTRCAAPRPTRAVGHRSRLRDGHVVRRCSDRVGSDGSARTAPRSSPRVPVRVDRLGRVDDRGRTVRSQLLAVLSDPGGRRPRQLVESTIGQSAPHHPRRRLPTRLRARDQAVGHAGRRTARRRRGTSGGPHARVAVGLRLRFRARPGCDRDAPARPCAGGSGEPARR